jgi:hypothetical protein
MGEHRSEIGVAEQHVVTAETYFIENNALHCRNTENFQFSIFDLANMGADMFVTTNFRIDTRNHESRII